LPLGGIEHHAIGVGECIFNSDDRIASNFHGLQFCLFISRKKTPNFYPPRHPRTFLLEFC
jgi:hypothetical protein